MLNIFAKAVCKINKGIRMILSAGLIMILSWSGLAHANIQVPPEVESQLQGLEERFSATLTQECPSSICSMVGCEVLRFRTLDQKQNSSLPGLGDDEEAVDAPRFRLEAAKCEFTYEASLDPSALVSLRQRLSAKVRQSSLALTVLGRRLDVASAALKGVVSPPIQNLPKESTSAFWNALSPVLPTAVLMVLGTLGLLALIWGFRKLGKPAPVQSGVAAKDDAKNGDAKAEAPSSSLEKASNAPTAFMVMTKKEQLTKALKETAGLSELALKPVIASGDVSDICAILRHFGPESLSYFANQTENRELFERVRKEYEKREGEETTEETWRFLERVERLVALAQLGRQDSSIADELAFLKDLAPDEFALLVQELSDDEWMSILSFTPAPLRASYLRSCTAEKADQYFQHVLRYPRVPDMWVRGVSRRLRELYTLKHAEIKNLSQEQLPILEQLLNTLAPSQRESLIRRLKTEQSALFEQLVSSVVLDRGLIHLPEPVLNELFLQIAPEEAAAYLDIHPDRHAVLKRLKTPLANSIRQYSRTSHGTVATIGLELDFVETSDPTVEQARQKIMSGIKEKSAAGVISLRSINEAVMDVG